MKHFIIIFYASILNIITKLLMLSDVTMCFRFLSGFNNFRYFNANAKAYLEFVKAKNNVPAYKAFLLSKKFTKPTFTKFVANMSQIPETDKENYVKRYTIDQRCIGGKTPSKGVIIDESSGSSGTATNWIRGKKERAMNAKMIQFGMRKLFGSDPIFHEALGFAANLSPEGVSA